jgi:hypothetical protein
MGKETVCLGCSKKFNKSEHSLQCTICALWIHKACANVTDDLYNLIEKQMKITGTTYWACRPCTAYAQGITARMKQIEDRLERTEKKVEENKKETEVLDKKVDKIEGELKKKDDKVEKAVKEAEYRMMDEMREREARRRNVVFHNIGEAENEKATGRERMDWDRKSCVNIFRALELGMEESAVRFCRRVGEKKGDPRPLICGFWDEQDRNKMLRHGRRLEETRAFKDVTVGPDLTKMQRREEADMRAEADRRNEEELTEEDRSKNLKWAVLGDRGQKSLIKTSARDQRGRGRGAGGTVASRSQRVGQNSGEEERRMREEEKRRPTGAISKVPRGAVRGGRYAMRDSRNNSARERTEVGGRRSEAETGGEEEEEVEEVTGMETEGEEEEEAEEIRTEDGTQRKQKRKERSPHKDGADPEEPPVKR